MMWSSLCWNETLASDEFCCLFPFGKTSRYCLEKVFIAEFQLCKLMGHLKEKMGAKHKKMVCIKNNKQFWREITKNQLICHNTEYAVVLQASSLG